MSEVRVNNIVDYGGKGAPTFDNGAVISGVSSLGNQAKIGSNVTITSGGINVSGVTTAATLSGNLTGDVNSGFVTATSAVIGSGVTINAGGLNITGVVTATTFEGSGASMTGVAMTITPLSYNPDVSDSGVPDNTGIGITFDHRILAGSGNVTLSVATNAGAAGTTVENFGVGSSVTIAGRKATISPASNLTEGDTYHISYPSGAFTNTGGDVDYVGTAYTFGVVKYTRQLFMWGDNEYGQLGLNQATPVKISSPTQLPGTNWSSITFSGQYNNVQAIKTDGTLWTWGENQSGVLGQNNNGVHYSSPVQIPGTTWASASGGGRRTALMNKTDGTLWAVGSNSYGALGQNSPDNSHVSSPIQIPGTTWGTEASKITSGFSMGAIKTDGTLWSWGYNSSGAVGDNSRTHRSSPVQIPGTTWKWVQQSESNTFAIKTDGTLWSWGQNQKGELGHNDRTYQSSPTQVPGTTWASLASQAFNTHRGMFATKTDGTLWMWGYRGNGTSGTNEYFNGGYFSSPVQIPGTAWSTDKIFAPRYGLRTDGSLWAWGSNDEGELGVNNRTKYSSPVQIPGTTWIYSGAGGQYNKRGVGAIKRT